MGYISSNFFHFEEESALTKGQRMKRSRFSDEQVIDILQEHEAGAKCAELTTLIERRGAPTSKWKL